MRNYIKRGHVNYILISTVAIIGILFITAVVLLVTRVIIPSNQTEPEEEQQEVEQVAAEYKNTLENEAVREALDTVDESILTNSFSNYNFEQVDVIYSNLVNEIEDYHDKAILFLDKANRLEFYSPSETDRIVAALQKAHAYDPKDITIMRKLYKIYENNDRQEDMAAIKADIFKYYDETIVYEGND